ncbi:MAG TPA: hypothetical protein VF792_10850 [Ktedonobacterales bacterium]
MSARMKQIGMGALLCLTLGLTLLFAVSIVHAIGRFNESRKLSLSGDVRTIRPWMTIPYIARVYHVPETYLLETLHISDPASVRHVTLFSLSSRMGMSTDALIKQIQTAILTYRKQHPPEPPTPPRQGDSLPVMGRAPPL